jgi:hypothetical protein
VGRSKPLGGNAGHVPGALDRPHALDRIQARCRSPLATG